jgi:xenotropic and polytropic retrovirus receptor 1
LDPLRASPAPIAGASRNGRSLQKETSKSAALVPGERASLKRSPARPAQYGSFPSAPAAQHAPAHTHAATGDRSAEFELPAPALNVPDNSARPSPQAREPELSRLAIQRSRSMAANVGGNRTFSPVAPSRGATGLTSAYESPRQRLQRLFSVGSPLARRQSSRQSGVSEQSGMDMRNLDEVREREREFYQFLDRELEKIESFYKQKEDQAGERLDLLRTQLHEMRDRRSEEVQERKRLKERGHSERQEAKEGNGIKHGAAGWMDPLKAKILKVGPNSKALNRMAWTPMLAGSSRADDGRDYTRRPTEPGVPYRTAKRKLKLALQEFYRGLELLKSYALLNRTAFRKLNKKYDKAVNARPPLRYLNEKVNKAWFVNSDALDTYITTVEDLYARYFEGGNHKLAAGKLRKLGKRDRDESGSAFRNGVMIGIGGVFTIQALTYGAELLYSADQALSLDTSYLLQIYAGYFLMLYLFGMFCLDCWIWKRNKVNYPFIFEFDPRHHLDWRQLAEFPSFFLMLFGVVMWLNFTRVGPDSLYLWYPVILVGLSLVILLFPAPVLGHKSRTWFLYSHWRLLLAGIYPVEFRDFFLGDIYCSLTYAMAVGHPGPYLLW